MKVFKWRLGRTIKSQTPNVTPALIGAGVTLLLSPISIFLGFWLNNVLARPILTIEYASLGQIVTHPKLNSNSYGVGLQLRQMGFEIEPEALTNRVFYDQKSSEEYLRELQSFVDILDSRLSVLATTEPSLEGLKKFSHWNEVVGSDLQLKIISNMSPKQSREYISDKILAYERNIRKVISETENILSKINSYRKCETYVQVLILNKGGSEGLIKAQAEFLTVKGQKVSFVETSAPPSPETNSSNAVRTYVTNEEISFLTPTNSVGLVPSRTISKFWFRSEEPACDIQIDEVALETHIGNRMSFLIKQGN